MSLKLYNGYIYRGSAISSANELFALSRRIQSVLRPISQRSFFSTYAREIAEVVDRAWLGVSTGPADKRAIDIVQERVESAWKQLDGGMRSPTWDVGAEWIFFQVESRLLVYFVAEKPLIEAFERRFPEFRDYHFQDSSSPEGVDRHEWEQRRRDWLSILKHGSLFEGGLTMRLWGPRTEPRPVDLDFCLRACPSFNARVKKIARDIAMERWVTRRVPSDQTAPHKVVGAMREWVERSSTSAVRARMRHSVVLYGRVLPRVLDREIVTSTVRALRKQGRDALRNAR